MVCAKTYINLNKLDKYNLSEIVNSKNLKRKEIKKLNRINFLSEIEIDKFIENNMDKSTYELAKILNIDYSEVYYKKYSLNRSEKRELCS